MQQARGRDAHLEAHAFTAAQRLYIWLAMPYLDAPYNVSPSEFDAIFGSAKIMYVASLSAYLVGQMGDIAMTPLIYAGRRAMRR